MEKVLTIASQILAVMIIASGIIAFVFKTWISEWIKNKFSRAVSKELEVQKHQLNKDLEEYRNSLVRELEQFKANIDIKRSITLKMADARLEALRQLYARLDRYNNECMSWPCLTTNLRQLNHQELNTAIAEMRQALREAEIFLPLQTNADISTYNLAAIQLIGEYPADREERLLPADDRLSVLRVQFSGISTKLRELIYEGPAQL